MAIRNNYVAGSGTGLPEGLYSTTAPSPTVRVSRVAPAGRASAVAVVALAFSTDPVARWVYPDPSDYLDNFPRFIRAFAGRSFGSGGALIAENLAGAALWLPPDVHPDENELDALVIDSTTAKIRRDLMPVLEEMGASHPDGPHWYLPMIGVDTHYQNKGVGSALMAEALRRVDEDCLPAYLESSNPRNIPLYQRFGFEIVRTIQVGDSPPLFPMLRKPQIQHLNGTFAA